MTGTLVMISSYLGWVFPKERHWAVKPVNIGGSRRGLESGKVLRIVEKCHRVILSALKTWKLTGGVMGARVVARAWDLTRSVMDVLLASVVWCLVYTLGAGV